MGDWANRPSAFIAETLRMLAAYHNVPRQQDQSRFFAAAAERLEALEEIADELRRQAEISARPGQYDDLMDLADRLWPTEGDATDDPR